MKCIPLTKGKFAMVDDEDYEWLNQYKWYAYEAKPGKFYARRNRTQKEGSSGIMWMHREILGLQQGDKRNTDHRNHHTLDNVRSNIRACTSTQNHQNQTMRRNNTSGYKGVSFNKQLRKWQSEIQVAGKRIFLGLFRTAVEAARQYDNAAIKHFGDFACTNKVMDKYS